MRQLKITKSITNRESASLDKYLQEIGREELVSPEEEVELAQRIRIRDLVSRTLSMKETSALSRLRKNSMRPEDSSSSLTLCGGSASRFCRLLQSSRES